MMRQPTNLSSTSPLALRPYFTIGLLFTYISIIYCSFYFVNTFYEILCFCILFTIVTYQVPSLFLQNSQNTISSDIHKQRKTAECPRVLFNMCSYPAHSPSSASHNYDCQILSQNFIYSSISPTFVSGFAFFHTF